MVNTTVTLKGKHFPPNTTIQFLECGKTSWLAPSEPCLEASAKEVTTGAKGRFETTFKAGVCPEAERTKNPTEVSATSARSYSAKTPANSSGREAQGQLPLNR